MFVTKYFVDMIFRKGLKNIKVYKPGKPIEEVKRSLGLKEVNKLASNEIPFPPTHIRASIVKELKNINRYPESGCFYLRKALAKELKVKGNQIIFGNGSDEIIVLALRAMVSEGDEVVVAYPTFLIYEIQARVQGAKVIRAPLNNFRYDLERMADKVNRKTKIVFIANPDNPTGTYLDHDQVKNFLRRIPKNVLVYFDEAYFEFAPSDFPRTKRLLQRRGNIIFSRTFSKAFGLAGLRIGYAVSTASIANILNKVREPFNVNRLAQVSALAALKNKKFLKQTLTHIQKEKEYLYRGLRRYGLEFIESATNFILVNFKKNTGSLYNYMLRRGIIVRELKGWGIKNLFRVTAGTHKENKKFLDCLGKYLLEEGR